jgi:phosphoglycolate phosphatase
MPLRAILFDLDGTLVQTRDSSWKLFGETNRAFGLGIEAQKDYFALFEDNFFASLRRLCEDDERASEAGRHFLNLLQTAYSPDLVPGMCDVVRALAGTYSLAVLSSNSVSAIRRILTEANIAHCFSHVFAGDVETDKRVSVRRFLSDQSYAVNRACSPAYREYERPTVPNCDEVVLITDTVGDVKHAKECGIRAIGVAWGMHSEAQLLAAGAEMVAVWPQEIVAHLLPGGFSAAVCACEPVPSPVQRQNAAGTTDCSCTHDPVHLAAGIRRTRAIDAVSRLAEMFAPAPRASFTDLTLLGALRRISREGAGRMGRSAIDVARDALPLRADTPVRLRAMTEQMKHDAGRVTMQN